MQIRSAGRPFALFVILVTSAVFAMACLMALVPFWLDRPIDWMAAVILVPATGIAAWMLRGAWRFIQVYRQSPYFRIDITPGSLTIKNPTHDVTIQSSDVEDYYFSNDRVRIRLRSAPGGASMTPYMTLDREWLTISLNKLGGPIHLSQALREFDPDIDAKSRVGLRAILEMFQ